jgi:hypothetical protein
MSATPTGSSSFGTTLTTILSPHRKSQLGELSEEISCAKFASLDQKYTVVDQVILVFGLSARISSLGSSPVGNR